MTSPNSADYSVAYSATYGSLTQAVAEKDDYLIDLLVDLGFVDEDQVEQSRQEAEAAGMRPEEEGRPEAPEKPGLFEIPTFLNKGSFKGF